VAPRTRREMRRSGETTENYGGVLSFGYHPPRMCPNIGLDSLESNDCGVRQDSGTGGHRPPARCYFYLERLIIPKYAS